MNFCFLRRFAVTACLVAILSTALALTSTLRSTPERSTASAFPPGLLLYPLVSLPLVHALLSR